MRDKILKKILKECNDRKKREEKIILYNSDEENIILDNSEIKNEIKIIEKFYGKEDLARQFLDSKPIYYDKSQTFWEWKKKGKWERVDDIEILNLIKAASDTNIVRPAERIEILNAVKQEGRTREPEEIENTWIQFQNEVVDLETGNRFEATPEYFFTNPIPHKLGKCEDTPTMDKILGEWVGEKFVPLLYQLIAFCLLTFYPIHRIFCLIGSGSNGKSCFLRLLEKFLGKDNVTSTELDILLNSRFEITKLHKKLACIMGETDFNEIQKTSILKRLTGEDTIRFEMKHKTPFDDHNYAKIIIATNNLPATNDKTAGFYRRWIIIDFINQFDEKTDILATIPEEEYNNLALKCVGILIDLLKNREFANEGTIEERTKRYEDKSDPLQKFLNEFIEEDVDAYITKNDFLKKLNDWCVENRFRKISEQTLGKRMKDKGIETGKKYFDWLHEGKGGQARVWYGIKWK